VTDAESLPSADFSALRARRLVERGAQAVGKLDRVIVRPEVHEEQARLSCMWLCRAVTAMPCGRSAVPGHDGDPAAEHITRIACAAKTT
jgi:hypothetical protein